VEQDRQAFAEFYADARDDCLRIVLISVGDRQMAEDLVAEAFTKAWMAWRKVSQRRNHHPLTDTPRRQAGVQRYHVTVHSSSRRVTHGRGFGWGLVQAGQPLHCIQEKSAQPRASSP
jgi:hypothetical protein